MTSVLARRFAASLLLLYLVLTVTFFLVHLAPGDPASLLGAGMGGREAGERLRRVYGLDRPLAVQYLDWLRAVAIDWDWGTSYVYGQPATRVIVDSLPPTLLLGATALLVQYAIGLPLGVAAARRAGRPADGAIRVGSLLFYSMPTFWLGLMAILLLAYRFPVLPGSHMRSVDAGSLAGWERLLDLLLHLALPAFTLGLTLAGGTVRFVRNRMLEVLEEGYVRTARAKGLSERRVVWVHALRNALVPVIQLLGLSIPFILNGSLIVEVVFSWPGLGRTTFQAILARDYPVILASTAFTGALVVAGNFLADVLHAAVDPRVRRAAG